MNLTDAGLDPSPEPVDLVTALPDRVRLDAFQVAGPVRRFNYGNKHEIPQLWAELIAALPLTGQTPEWRSYGVITNVDSRRGSFDYQPGVAVRGEDDLPGGFQRRHVPGALYAVFRITLDGSALHPQAKQAMAHIWGELIPASGLRVADGPDLEVYDERFAPDRAGAQFDFYVPIED